MVPDTRAPTSSPLERRYLIGVFRVSSGAPVEDAEVNVLIGLVALTAGGILGYLHILSHGHTP